MPSLLRRLEIEWWIMLLAACLLFAFAWPIQRSFSYHLKSTLAQSADPNLERLLRGCIDPARGDSANAQLVATIERTRQWQAVMPIIVEEQQKAIAGLAGGLLLLLAGLALLSGRALTRPLKRLALAAERIGQGEKADIRCRSGGALGRLERSMASMQEELAKLRERALAEGMEQAWRDLARVMAHEIKNPLTPMRLTLDRIQESVDAGAGLPHEDLQRFIRRITSQVENLERLVNDFRSFARGPEPHLKPVSLAACVSATAEGMRGSIATAIEGDATVQADPRLLDQVLLNLWKNAAEAGAKSVVVTITAGDRAARMVVRDDGPGIPDDRVQRVWVPYVTYKQGGTGLGLPVVKTLLAAMGATVELTSSTRALDHGVTIVIQWSGGAPGGGREP